jgi:hypothetical protein
MSASYSPHSFFQRYRIQLIEQWPQGERQQASLQAAKAALLRDLVYEGAAPSAGSAAK